jgi:hypothetical protein
VVGQCKQVRIILKEMDPSSIFNFVSLCVGVNALLVVNCGFNYSNQFQAFSNIHHLILKNIRGILKVDLYLEKTVKLEVKSCRFTQITNWNSQSTLEHLVIRDCPDLHSLPPLGNISTAIVASRSKVKIQFGNQNKFSFHGQYLTLETMQLMSAQLQSTKYLQDFRWGSLIFPFVTIFRFYRYATSPFLNLFFLL